MAINNVDIYGDEWIELVFENRNKSYGAYELRKHYASTVLKALALTFGSIGAVIYLAFLLFKPAPIAAQPLKHEVTTVLQQVVVAAADNARSTRHTHHHTKSGHSYSSAQQVVVSHNSATLSTPAIVPVIEHHDVNPGEQAAIAVVEDKNVYTQAVADTKPSPIGGAQGWISYLQKNLVYPEDARHQHISGKVQLSFIVEKDGSITDITVEQPAGHGFDEEAVRVLQQSPVWQPGIKDGQPIRIRYRLPVNFQMVH